MNEIKILARSMADYLQEQGYLATYNGNISHTISVGGPIHPNCTIYFLHFGVMVTIRATTPTSMDHNIEYADPEFLDKLTQLL